MAWWNPVSWGVAATAPSAPPPEDAQRSISSHIFGAVESVGEGAGSFVGNTLAAAIRPLLLPLVLLIVLGVVLTVLVGKLERGALTVAGG